MHQNPPFPSFTSIQLMLHVFVSQTMHTGKCMYRIKLSLMKLKHLNIGTTDQNSTNKKHEAIMI